MQAMPTPTRIPAAVAEAATADRVAMLRPDLDARARAALAQLEGQSRLRRLRTFTPEGVIDFSSNDYLGLARHPLLIARAMEWTERYGAGARASRLVTGTLPGHVQVEERLAALKGCEAALVLNSGYQANAGLLPALLDADLLGATPVVLADRLIHASMHAGVRASGAEMVRFRHNDMEHLETLLIKHGGAGRVPVILTESVFSMDGDIAPLSALSALAHAYGALLYVDEAHATGVLGEGGAGLARANDADIIMGTFSKGLGGFGAYVCGSRALCDYFVNRCAAFIYSTALPPAVLGAMDAALELLPALDGARARVLNHAARLRERCSALGFDTGNSETQIVPVILGGERETLAAARQLEERGILGIAIRPPTVPPGAARIRFALSAAHTDDEVDRLSAALTEMRP